jgi:hypothetical protein
MRKLAGPIAHIKQESGNRVWDHRTLCAQHTVSAHVFAFNFHDVSEFRGVADFNFKKQNRIARRQVVILTVIGHLSAIFFRVGLLRAISDDANCSVCGRLVQKPFGRIVKLNTLHAQFSRARES